MRHAIRAGSMFGAAAIIALWVRSTTDADFFAFHTAVRTRAVVSADGGLAVSDFYSGPLVWKAYSQWHHFTHSPSQATHWAFPRHRRLGFGAGRRVFVRRDGSTHSDKAISVPYWFLSACCALPAILTSRRRKRRARFRLCPACGYDLRATPHQCPECGAIPPVVAKGAVVP